MKKSSRVFIFLLLALCLLTVLPKSADAAKYLIRAATVLIDESPTAKCLFMFRDIVESQTWGDVEVQVFTGGKLGDERPNIEAIQLNNIQVATPSVGVLANFSNEVRVINLPFLLTNQKVAFKVLEEDPIGKKILAGLSKIGIIGLGFTDYGMRNLTSKKKIKTLADLKGMKVRTMKVPDHLTLWKSLGANPTPIAWSEVYTALQQGVVDGQENPFETIYLTKFYEVQKYITVVGHIYDVQPVIMSKKFYDSLPPNYQKIMYMAADIATKFNWYLTGEQNLMYKEQCEKAGMKVNYFSEADMAKSRELNKPLFDQIRKVAGDALVNEYIAAVEKAKKELK
ncbi:MAG: TRAP transporter substrate-binding protein [Deltaproteobacteria bacterium]|nr:TRAP transporter substrate-binding protein [Deltaproteobacteria bacterium]MBW2305435.1 TRAP transporter substrate-binding protein [Deltaproteobacteria bacterium]